MWWFSTDKRILDLQSQLDAKDRVIGVMQAELDSMAAVIARDRQRVQAEDAEYGRRRALAEGKEYESNESVRRFSA